MLISIVLPIIVVTLLTGLGIGLYYIFVWRKAKQKMEQIFKEKDLFEVIYETKHKITVSLTKRVSEVSKEQIELWTDHLLNFWSHHYPNVSLKDMIKSVEDCMVATKDITLIPIVGSTHSHAYALSYPENKTVFIGTIPEKGSQHTPETWFESLYCHELNHIILAQGCGEWDYEKHHKLMSQYKVKGA